MASRLIRDVTTVSEQVWVDDPLPAQTPSPFTPDGGLSGGGIGGGGGGGVTRPPTPSWVAKVHQDQLPRIGSSPNVAAPPKVPPHKKKPADGDGGDGGEDYTEGADGGDDEDVTTVTYIDSEGETNTITTYSTRNEDGSTSNVHVHTRGQQNADGSYNGTTSTSIGSSTTY